jgi:orotidine-5'-phosphate decarboxylase
VAELIVALDVPDRDRALAVVDRLGEGADFYKVGLELFTRWGPAGVRELRERGKRVFLDLKLHDIPNTVAGAVRSAAALGADLLTVHAAGGSEMVAAAAEASAASAGPRILAVTVLTSMESEGLEAVWGREVTSTLDEVLRLAAMACDAGAQGVVASPREAAALRARLGSGRLIVTPGIRMAGGEVHDQVRVATPREAVRAGADHLVLGRAVTAAGDPSGALARVRREMEAA